MINDAEVTATMGFQLACPGDILDLAAKRLAQACLGGRLKGWIRNGLSAVKGI